MKNQEFFNVTAHDAQTAIPFFGQDSEAIVWSHPPVGIERADHGHHLVNEASGRGVSGSLAKALCQILDPDHGGLCRKSHIVNIDCLLDA